MLTGGPGVYPWSFQGGYRSPEDLRGEIEIPPDPLARAERKRKTQAAALHQQAESISHCAEQKSTQPAAALRQQAEPSSHCAS